MNKYTDRIQEIKKDLCKNHNFTAEEEQRLDMGLDNLRMHFEMQDAIRESGFLIKGRGEMKANPLLSKSKACYELYLQTLRSLKIKSSAEKGPKKKKTTFDKKYGDL